MHFVLRSVSLGLCNLGALCNFAHSPAELRPLGGGPGVSAPEVRAP